jgi:FkbM family methyltransferase
MTISHELVRFILPRFIRNILRAPKLTLEFWRLSLISLFGRNSTCHVRDTWEPKCHPVSLTAFQAHSKVEEFRQELDSFVQYSTPGMVLLDIGCHYGVFTLAALHYGGSKSRVIAVDPSKVSQRIFQKNLKLAGISERVDFIDAAVGSKTGTLSMLSTGAAGHHMMVSSNSRSDVSKITLHTITSIIEMAGQKPTHIKIDVEGYEDEVIAGGKDYLEQLKPIIFLELHTKMMRDAGKSPEKLLTTLSDIGYVFERYHMPITISKILDMDICRLVCIAK